MQSEEPKLTERRYLWLTEGTCDALRALSGGRRREEASIMRAGIEAEVARRQAIAPTIDAVTAQLISSAQARGLDVRQVLTDALEQRLAGTVAEVAA